MRLSPVFLTLCAAAFAAPHAMAQLNKCLDDKGRITYSDQLCASAPKPSETPRAAQISRVTGGKLTETGVAALIRHAADMANASDYRGQCALAAPDLAFSITEQASGSPPSVVKGARADLCALQRTSAQAIETNKLKPVVKLGKVAITLNAAGTQATAVYESATTLSSKGQVVLQQRCARQDTLGVYGDRILYSNLTATCKTS